MPTFFCIVIAFAVSAVIGAILMKTNLLGIGKAFAYAGLPKFIVISAELIVIVVIFIISFFITFNYSKGDYDDVYYTTKTNLGYYNKIDNSKKARAIGQIPSDSVLKVKHFTLKEDKTWLESYVLTDGRAEKVYVLVPMRIHRKIVRQNSSYYEYHNTSKSFNAYYEEIDRRNEQFKKNLQSEFVAELKSNGVVVQKASSYSSVESDAYTLPINGCVDMYVSSNNEIYYVPGQFGGWMKSTIDDFNNRLKSGKEKYFKD